MRGPFITKSYSVYMFENDAVMTERLFIYHGDFKERATKKFWKELTSLFSLDNIRTAYKTPHPTVLLLLRVYSL
jgi:hypothetical protein